ncbi:MAG: response regulator [Sorangiineae bacterium]|nr:response regulator [Polyangiaceae bacterium]MEB2322870.1 response regulator [Sorangiineae bacterium]
MTPSVLAVDDSATMRKALEITFAGEDYRTLLAGSGADALAQLRAERPSLVLVDAQLGGESGYDLCQAIKREAPGTPVIILSSKQQPYDRGRGTMVGADDFMDKPFDTQQLLDKVAATLRKAGEQPAAPPPMAEPPATQAPYRAPAPAIASAPPPQAPPASSAQRRPPTLAYGTPAPAPLGASPAPSPAPAPVGPRSHTVMGTPAPAPVAPRPAAAAAPVAPTPMSGTPVAPRPSPAAPPAVATAAAAATDGGGELAGKLAGLGLDSSQVAGVLALSREVVEKVVWEVVPILAETLIKEEIRRLTSE